MRMSREVIRYSPRALFCIAVVFVAAAPTFWMRTQVNSGVVAAAYENASLYQDVYPAFHYGFGRVCDGELPLWNPKQLCGAPFQANPACVLFQPLHLVFALAPAQTAMALHGFISLTLGGLFFVLFARSLGAAYIPCLIGGVAYAFSGAASAAAGLPGTSAALAWAPLMFWALRQYGESFRLEKAAFAGLAAGLLILSGSTAMAGAFLALGGVYGLFLVFFSEHLEAWRPYRGRAVLHRIEGLLLAMVVALGVSAVQWVPTLMWAWSLDQPLAALFVQQIHGRLPGSIQELLAHLIVPRPGNLPRVGYMGAFVLLAVPASVFHLRARRHAFFFLGAGVLALSAGAGVLPEALGRGPFLYPLVFCLAVLGMLGFDRLLVPGGEERAPRVWLQALLVLALAGALLYAVAAPSRGRIVVFLVLLIPAVLIRAHWVSVVAGLGSAIVLFADLTSAGASAYAHPFQDAAAWYQRYGNTLRTAEEQALDARVIVSSHVLDFSLPSNLGMLFPVIHAADGLLPLTHEQTIWWRRLGRNDALVEAEKGHGGISPEAGSPNLINFMSVKAVLAAPDGPLYAGTWARPGPALREMKTGDAVRLFLNEQALPRAYWAPSWRMAEGVAAAADTLADPAFPAREMCVVDRDSRGYGALVELLPAFQPRAEQPQPIMPPDVHCRIEESAAERVVVRAGAPQPGILVLSDTLAGGWRATLDGQPAPILRVNGLFRGIAMPSGPHEIVFEYRPLSYVCGLIFSLATLLALVLGGLAVLVRR